VSKHLRRLSIPSHPHPLLLPSQQGLLSSTLPKRNPRAESSYNNISLYASVCMYVCTSVCTHDNSKQQHTASPQPPTPLPERGGLPHSLTAPARGPDDARSPGPLRRSPRARSGSPHVPEPVFRDSRDADAEARRRRGLCSCRGGGGGLWDGCGGGRAW